MNTTASHASKKQETQSKLDNNDLPLSFNAASTATDKNKDITSSSETGFHITITDVLNKLTYLESSV